MQDEKPEQDFQDVPVPDDSRPHVEWTASEYVANQKTAAWFVLLAGGTIGLATIVYLVTEDIVSTAVIPILGIILGIFAARQPRVLNYAVDNTGVHIAEKFYPYNGFKSFSLAEDQAIHYISLSPLRRFMPPLVIHFDPEDEEKITDTLASYLPYEEHKRDLVDNLTRRFRF